MMSKLSELGAEIGRRGWAQLQGARRDKVWVPVEVTDVRLLYGRLDYLVRPIDGDGVVWVRKESMKWT